MQKFPDVIPAKLVPDSDPGAGIQFCFNRLRILDAESVIPGLIRDRHDERTLDSQAYKKNEQETLTRGQLKVLRETLKESLS